MTDMAIRQEVTDRSKIMKCPNCGKEINGNQKFCTSCGTKLDYITHETNNNKNIEIQVVEKYIIEKIKIFSIRLLAIFLLALVISGGINLFNEYKIKQALNISSYTGNKILIKTNHKFTKDQKIIFDNELKNKYGESIYITTSAGNKAVIYSPKNIKPQDIMSYLTRPVVEFKKKDYKDKWVDTGLNDKYIKKALANTSPYSEEWIVEIELTKEGAEKFAQLTKELTGRELGIFYNNKLLSAPRVNEQIVGGHAQITGGSNGFKQAEAKEMANILSREKNIQILEVK